MKKLLSFLLFILAFSSCADLCDHKYYKVDGYKHHVYSYYINEFCYDYKIDDNGCVTLKQVKTTCMNDRNLWMTEHSNYVIAVHDGSKGGTYNCIQDALKKGLCITTINPNTIK